MACCDYVRVATAVQHKRIDTFLEWTMGAVETRSEYGHWRPVTANGTWMFVWRSAPPGVRRGTHPETQNVELMMV